MHLYRRRLVAGFCVLLTHGLALWALLYIANPVTVVMERTLMFKVVERTELAEPAPPPPDFTPMRPPSIVAIMPEFTIAPAPSAIVAKPTPPPPPAPPQEAVPPMKQGSMPPSDYLARLVAHLNAFKRYPYASGTHAQGTVRLRFRMDRRGRLISYEVVGSSGSAALDQAARDMIKMAEPLPPVPDQYPGDVLDLVVPINYTYVVR